MFVNMRHTYTPYPYQARIVTDPERTGKTNIQTWSALYASRCAIKIDKRLATETPIRLSLLVSLPCINYTRLKE
ncbi:hypothetical protein EMIT0P294_11060 [Pseudomonas sp. IT-P294]